MPFSARTGCLITLVTGLLMLTLCTASARLLIQGELRWTRGDLRETRLWLLRVEDASGLGFSRMRIISGSETAGSVCLENVVRFWLWSGEDQDPGTSYCECYERGGQGWRSTGACPP